MLSRDEAGDKLQPRFVVKTGLGIAVAMDDIIRSLWQSGWVWWQDDDVGDVSDDARGT